MERNELNRLIAISSTTKTATMMMVWTISGLSVPVSQCRVRSLVWSVGPAGSSLPSTPFPPLLCFALLTPTLAKLGPHCTFLGITFTLPRLRCGPQGPAAFTGVCIMKRGLGRKTRSRVRQSTPCCARNTLLFFLEQIGCGGRKSYCQHLTGSMHIYTKHHPK